MITFATDDYFLDLPQLSKGYKNLLKTLSIITDQSSILKHSLFIHSMSQGITEMSHLISLWEN